MLIAHQRCSCCRAVLTQSQGLSSTALPGRGQLTSDGQRDVPYPEVLCGTIKLRGLAGGQLLLRDWPSIVWQVLSNCVAHRLFCLFCYHYFPFIFCHFPSLSCLYLSPRVLPFFSSSFPHLPEGEQTEGRVVLSCLPG